MGNTSIPATKDWNTPDTRPTSQMLIASPKSLPRSMDPPMADARISFGTACRNTRLIGESVANINTWPTAIVEMNIAAVGAVTARSAIGTAHDVAAKESAKAFFIRSGPCMRSSTHPPSKVPTDPVTTMMPPNIAPAEATESPY